jgi:hypothetical protein
MSGSRIREGGRNMTIVRHACPYCGKAFDSRQAVIDHSIIIHPGRPVIADLEVIEERMKVIERNKRHADAARAYYSSDPTEYERDRNLSGAIKKEAPRAKKSETTLELVEASLADLFSDQYGKPYAVIHVEEHLETIALGSGNFRHWISKVYYEEKKATLSSEDVNGVLNTLKGRALFDGPRRSIQLRTASIPGESTIYYDLTDKTWRVVKITEEGWSIGQGPILFARFSNQLPQVEPARDYPAEIFEEFLDLINIASSNIEHRLLLKVYLVALFIPQISKPILDVHGEQGSAKTFLQKILKSVADPSAADALALPKNPDELIQQLSHNYVALYDNLSKLPEWASDIFCKAVTGAGSSKRMLYSDDDDVVYNFKRCIMLNGINIVARKPDLLDRALMIQLGRIPSNMRRKESDLLEKLESIKPKLLGCIFDILVQVLRRRGEVHLSEYPSRLVDFSESGELVSRCIGEKEGAFTSAYFGNQKLQTLEVVDSSPVAATVMKLMEEISEWGPKPPRELLEALKLIAGELSIDTKSKGAFPKQPNTLSRRLNEVKTSLREVGIVVEIATDSRTNTRTVSIRKIPPEPPVSPETQDRAQSTLPASGGMPGDRSCGTSASS